MKGGKISQHSNLADAPEHFHSLSLPHLLWPNRELENITGFAGVCKYLLITQASHAVEKP